MLLYVKYLRLRCRCASGTQPLIVHRLFSASRLSHLSPARLSIMQVSTRYIGPTLTLSRTTKLSKYPV